MSFDLKLNKGDLVINNGLLSTVVDSEKLIQDILKLCLTDVNGLPLHPWYGSFLSRTLVGNPLHTTVLIQLAKSQLNTALQNLKELQKIQVGSFQQVSADEQISSILGIDVNQNNIDPRLFNVVINVLTKGLKPLPVTFNIKTI